MELVLVTALMLTFMVSVMRDTTHLSDTTTAVAIAKAHTLNVLARQDDFYFLADVFPEALSAGRDEITLRLRIGGAPEPAGGGPPTLPPALVDEIVNGPNGNDGVRQKIIDTGIYTDVTVTVEAV